MRPLRLVVLAALACPSPAAAGTAQVVELRSATDLEHVVRYTAGVGEANAVVLTPGERHAIVVLDRAGVEPGPGCERAADGDPTLAICRGSEYTPPRVELALGDGDDAADARAIDNRLTASGGDGDDVLDGSANLTTLEGGDGADVLRAGAGRVSLDGGPGPDELVGGPRGDDEVSYRERATAVVADLDGDRDDGAAGEGDLIGADVEEIVGGAGADRLTGSPRRDQLYGGPGGDVVAGAGGDDWLDGGPGDDRLEGGDGDDLLWASSGEHDDRERNVLEAGAGEDDVFGSNGADIVRLGAGEDAFEGGGGRHRVLARDGRLDHVLCTWYEESPAGRADVDRHDVALRCGEVRRRGGAAATFLWLRGPHFALVACSDDVPRRCRGTLAASVGGRTRARGRFDLAPGTDRLVRLRPVRGAPPARRGERFVATMRTRDSRGRARVQRRALVVGQEPDGPGP
jgi:hypothetical protein